MKTLLLFISAIGLTLMSSGQTVTFDDYKKRADACFNQGGTIFTTGAVDSFKNNTIGFRVVSQ
ncbi:hypothetical protein [Runella sp.]|jgi:hypothetical protein|uniref:hypothetical protein n=1 Tax=Runella sp. TaxID=1960881 RepID=UPI003018A0BA